MKLKKRNSIDYLVVIVIVLAGIPSAVMSFGTRESTGRFVLEIGDSEGLKSVSVEISDQKFVFSNVQPGSMYQEEYRITSDSHYDILMTFENDDAVRKSIGYVTTGFIYEHKILIIGRELSLVSTTVK